MSRDLVMAAGLAWLGLATGVAAYSFAPAGAHFVSAGKMTLSAGGFDANCATVFEGVTDTAGAGRISKAVFSGGLLGVCNGIHALGLPWSITPVGPDRAVIAGVSVKTPFSGDCGPDDVPVAVSDGGVIRFTRVALRPKCSIDGGALVTKPSVAIVGR